MKSNTNLESNSFSTQDNSFNTKHLELALENWGEVFDSHMSKTEYLNIKGIKEMFFSFLSKQGYDSKQDMIDNFKQNSLLVKQLNTLSENNLGEFQLLSALLEMPVENMEEVTLFGCNLKEVDSLEF